MQSNTIQYAHAECKILVIQPPDWNQPKGYSAEIRVLLGPGTESLTATARTIPGGRAFIHCEGLFDSGPKGGIPLPLEIGDIVEFALEGADVRILAVRKGQSIVEPTASFTNMPINVLFAAHPVPPYQPAVGNAPIRFLTTLNSISPGSYDPTQFPATFNPSGKLTRTEVWEICRNRTINPLAAYAVAMAWGLQDPIDFTDSVKHGGLPHLLNALRISPNDRRSDFDVATKAKVRGLGIAFFTKVLYFFRPNPDAYILDQWTAKSACILFSPSPVRITSRGIVTATNAYYGPHSTTTADEYEAFCSAVDGLPPILWPGLGASGDRAEAAMFDKGGSWRQFVRDHYFHKEVGNSIRRKAICLTTGQDFDDGWLVLKKDKQIVVFVTEIKGGEGGLRVLLARLRELPATEVIFPTGNGGIPLPVWFIKGCNALGVAILGGGGSTGSSFGGGALTASNMNSEEEGNQDRETDCIIPPDVVPTKITPHATHVEPSVAMPQQSLRQLIVNAHHRIELPSQLCHEGSEGKSARITFTARPKEGNKMIRWQYHIGKREVRLDLFFDGDQKKVLNQIKTEITANPVGAKGLVIKKSNITWDQNIPIDPANLPATAAACVDAMKNFYDQLRASYLTIRNW